MTTNEYREILEQFLERWTISNVKEMTLHRYVGLRNKDTFCQWVETKTRMLGSIKGMPSIKFGIYERDEPAKKPKNYRSDDKYSWLRAYGENRKAAFQNIKHDIVEIIRLSAIGKFDQIDSMLLPNLFKWKIAFLYSNERLVPVHKLDVLFRIASHYHLSTNRKPTVSEIQNMMILNKPAYLSVYEFMRQMIDQFGDTKHKKEIIGGLGKARRRTTRKAVTRRNTDTQMRSATHSYIAEQKHNKIQVALERLLIEEYGKSNVILEESNVDIKVIQPNYISFYEVKSASFASDCIKEALGQILLYSLSDTDSRPKKHFVVGQYPATDYDQKFIAFLRRNLKVEFQYLNVEIE